MKKILIAGIGILGAVCGPAFAGVLPQSKGAQWGDITDYPNLNNVDGIYVQTKGPGGNVLAAPAWHWIMSYIEFPVSRGIVQFNAVGYLKYVPSIGTTIYAGAYEQVHDDGNGNAIDDLYYVTSVPYGNHVGQTVSSGMWRSNGSTWHYNWWTPSVNQGLDDTNPAASSNPRSYAAGGMGYNCYQDISNWPVWGLLLRTPGSWVYSPTLRQCASFGGINCVYGSNPTWAQPSGNLGWGATLSVSASCP